MSLSPWDLNCDLGELESPIRTRSLMRWITSANIACGGHAGTVESMERCVHLAAKAGVRLGAHPGPWDRANMGRGQLTLSPSELDLLLLQQVSALALLARRANSRLHHIKLHGGLYHAVEGCKVLAKAYVRIVQERWPRLKIYARHGGEVSQVGKLQPHGITIWEEAFVDRGYTAEGNLIPRGEVGALLETKKELRERLRQICDEGRIRTREGNWIPSRPRTLCIHGDTPAAPKLVRWAHEALRLA